MSKLNLNDYTDTEIVRALMSLPAHKFMIVIQSLDKMTKMTEKRSTSIVDNMADDVLDEFMRKLMGGE